MAFDFAAVTAPFRMQPGLRRLAEGSRQLTPSKVGDAALLAKLSVLRSHASQALLNQPGFDPASALDALCEQAAHEHPSALHWDGTGTVEAMALGWAVHGDQPMQLSDACPEVGKCLAALPAEWRRAALVSLAFAEDFAVIDGDTARIPWLAVCLPSQWAPENKVGRHFAEVHAPVADNQLLLTAADHLARLVTGTERWERFVWTITRHPHLDAHPARTRPDTWSADAGPAELAASAFFRTEHQTFIPLPQARLAIFTIHVGLEPLAAALSDPVHARQVHDALASMSPAVLGYRHLGDARERLLAWLAAQAGA
jgi:hypothetical protein